MSFTTKLLVLALSSPLHAALLRVPGEYPGIHEAVDAATDGDVILVAPGEYLIRRPVSFQGKSIVLRGLGGPEATVLRMAEDPEDPERRSVVIFEGRETAAARLEGFTLTGGAGTVLPWELYPRPWPIGGDILCLPGSVPTIESCLVTGNGLQEERWGVEGGGVFCLGAAPHIMGCEISGNRADEGGGLGAFGGAAPVLRDCRVVGNRSDAHGAGVFAGGSHPTLERCVIMGNWAREFGGAYSGGSATFVNCLIAGNLAVWEGGVDVGGEVRLVNCTVTGNAAVQVGTGVWCDQPDREHATVVNSIVWGNRNVELDEIPRGIGGGFFPRFCGEPADYPGSLLFDDEDPLFVRPGTFDYRRTRTIAVGGQEFVLPDFIVDPGDYRLQDGSAALDQGVLDGAAAVDLDGVERPCGSGVDIGAYERGSCEAPESTPFRRGDSNADGRLDLTDGVFVLRYLFSRGTTPGCIKAADTDDTGSIELTDGIYILRYLFLGGPPPPEPFQHCGADLTLDSLTSSQSPC